MRALENAGLATGSGRESRPSSLHGPDHGGNTRPRLGEWYTSMVLCEARTPKAGYPVCLERVYREDKPGGLICVVEQIELLDIGHHSISLLCLIFIQSMNWSTSQYVKQLST